MLKRYDINLCDFQVTGINTFNIPPVACETWERHGGIYNIIP